MAVNEYLRKAAAHRFRWSRWDRDTRDRLVTTYSWAIPNAKALRTLANYAPLVEIGAGSGYWASLLREMGVRVYAFDEEPPSHKGHLNGFFRCSRQGVEGKLWTEVRRGGVEWAARSWGSTLFLCWPPYRTSMAYDALMRYTQAGGQTVIYVGEGEPGCTGDANFHAALAEGWECVERVSIPRWEGMRDDLSVWKRKTEKERVA